MRIIIIIMIVFVGFVAIDHNIKRLSDNWETRQYNYDCLKGVL